tara:strand:+ start:292 stop:510 length:219 start_codon:yes stop_codon:yes gene_type:complete
MRRQGSVADCSLPFEIQISRKTVHFEEKGKKLRENIFREKITLLYLPHPLYMCLAVLFPTHPTENLEKKNSQ